MADLIEITTEELSRALSSRPRANAARRLMAALGGKWELAARFERPLAALADDYFQERLRAGLEAAERRGFRRGA